jgi:hypothetical protein
MALDAGTMIKKYHVALFLNGGTPTELEWKQIKKSTDNTITMNAETQTFDYIVDEAPTTEINRYAPSLSQPITMYKGEPDYEFVFDKFFNQAVGAAAHSEILIVFYGANDSSAYKAWKASCILQIDNMNPVESTITVTITFNGTTKKGTAVVTNGVPAFTSSAVTEFAYTVTATNGTTPIEGATVVIGGVEKTTDASGEAVFYLINGKTYVIGAYKGTLKASAVETVNSTAPAITLTLV